MSRQNLRRIDRDFGFLPVKNVSYITSVRTDFRWVKPWENRILGVFDSLDLI